MCQMISYTKILLIVLDFFVKNFISENFILQFT